MINLTQEEIMQTWGVDNSDTPLVSVKCMTFNHENYIAQALDGFLMQKTTFPFEVLVHDDASTDKTADIVREYEAKFPKIVKGIYETENQWSKPEPRLHHKKIDAAIKGKYIAFCEGDDYWIDENKLQMQVDCMENNTQFGIVYTFAQTFYQENKRMAHNKIGRPFISYADVFVNGNCIPTLTTCIKTSLYFKYLEELPTDEIKKWKMGDLPLCLWFIKNSNIFLIPKVTSVYRVLKESASHSEDESKIQSFKQSSLDIREFFARKYNDYELLEQYKIGENLDIAWKKKQREEFLKLYKDFNYPNKVIKIKKQIFSNIFLYKIFLIIRQQKKVK